MISMSKCKIRSKCKRRTAKTQNGYLFMSVRARTIDDVEKGDLADQLGRVVGRVTVRLLQDLRELVVETLHNCHERASDVQRLVRRCRLEN